MAKLMADHRGRWAGTLIPLFQPAEETGDGAQGMVDDGLFRRIPAPDVARIAGRTGLPNTIDGYCATQEPCGERLPGKGGIMAWRLDGTYFESCSCDAVCPCTWSALTAKATLDRCRALLAYHVESGQIDGVDVSGLSFALFLDTPPVMSEGNWRVGVYLDDTASDRQAEQLGAVLSGQAGGPPAMLGPLIGEMLERRGVRIGEAIDVGVEDFVAIEGHDPVQLTNVFHPSNTTLTVAPADAAHLSTFGIDWGREGQSGFSAPFSWSG